MTDWMGVLSESRFAVMIIFGAMIVFTVGGLEMLRGAFGRAPREERGGSGDMLAAVMAVAFLALLTLGGSDLEAHGQNFLNLAFALTGGAGLFILASLIWSDRHGLPLGDTEEETRRIAAHDL